MKALQDMEPIPMAEKTESMNEASYDIPADSEQDSTAYVLNLRECFSLTLLEYIIGTLLRMMTLL